MHVALTGISGFIGSVIARHLHDAGHTVTGLVRSTSRRDHIEPFVRNFVIGEQDDETAWPELLDGADAVIHNSVDWSVFKKSPDMDRHEKSNTLGSLRFLRLSAPRPFIFMSTIAVHHDMRPRWDGQIDEDHPLRPSSPYGSYKAAVEAHLWAEHFGSGRHTAAIRPSAVYGLDPNPTRSIGHPIIGKIQNGQPFDRAGGGKFVHVDDVAAVAVAALEKPEAAGQAFNMADCYARWTDWAHMIAEELGFDPSAIEHNSPAEPKNQFSKAAVQSLGIGMDRGFDGIRQHIRALIDSMKNADASA